VEGAFSNVNISHDEVRDRLNLHKKGLEKFGKWQNQCQDAYNKLIPIVHDLKKKDEEKLGQIETLLNEVAELRGLVESMRDKLCTCNNCEVRSVNLRIYSSY